MTPGGYGHCTGEKSHVSDYFSWWMPEPVAEDVRQVVEEIVRRGHWNETLGRRYQNHMRLWTTAGYALGVPAAALAAIAGFYAANSTDHNALAGGLALASAGIGAVLAALNPASKAANANLRSKAHFRIPNWARYVIAVELPTADHEVAVVAYTNYT